MQASLALAAVLSQRLRITTAKQCKHSPLVVCYHARDLRPSVLAVPRISLPAAKTSILSVHSSSGRALPMTVVGIAAQDLG